jgi:DNA helicase HerA-like ATPase
LIVIDEAHNICPQEPIDALKGAATEHAIRIAGEGRKYGLYTLLATQRPQKLHTNVVSQCDNLVLMRINSSSDIAHLASTFSFVPPSLLSQASHFSQGQALIAGKIVPSPLFAKFEGRISREGGSDVPADWATLS